MLDRVMEYVDNKIDRFMSILDIVLPIWFALIFISVLYQMWSL